MSPLQRMKEKTNSQIYHSKSYVTSEQLTSPLLNIKMKQIHFSFTKPSNECMGNAFHQYIYGLVINNIVFTISYLQHNIHPMIANNEQRMPLYTYLINPIVMSSHVFVS